VAGPAWQLVQAGGNGYNTSRPSACWCRCLRNLRRPGRRFVFHHNSGV